MPPIPPEDNGGGVRKGGPPLAAEFEESEASMGFGLLPGSVRSIALDGKTRAPLLYPGADESMAFVRNAGPGRCGGRRRCNKRRSSARGSRHGAQPSTSSPPLRKGCFDACKGVHLL